MSTTRRLVFSWLSSTDIAAGVLVNSTMKTAATLLLVASLALVACVLASSHSEAPGTANNPGADASDFYMFRSYESGRENYVTFIMNVKVGSVRTKC
jgi:hypothetical protein